MASTQAATLGNRQIQQALRRGAKDVLVAGGIQPSTRRGNKELTLAVQRLAQQSYSTLEEATQTGEALGQKIVEICQAKGLTDLDGGIVRQMMLTGDIPTVTKTTTKPAKTAPLVTEPKAPEPAPAPAVIGLEAEAAEVVAAEIVEVEPTEVEEDAIAADEPTEATAEVEAVEPEIESEPIEAEADTIAADEPAEADTKASESATATVEADSEPETVGAAL